MASLKYADLFISLTPILNIISVIHRQAIYLTIAPGKYHPLQEISNFPT